MGFDSLSDRLTIAMRNIAGNGKLTDKNMDRMLKEVRSALLDADVNYLVVKDFVARIRKEYEDMEVTPGLDPAEQVVTIVRDAIEEILGKEPAPLEYSSGGITVIMMVGLQGTGKTTSAVKLAKFIRDRQSRKPLLVAADVKRPAAIEQLQTLAATVDVEVFSLGPNVSALETSVKAVDYAKPEETGLPKANVLIYTLEDGSTVVVRPSGTEPKIKTYFTTLGKNLEEAQAEKDALAEAIKPVLA